ncbi:MAG: hypothetical protein JJ897_02880 [Marinibacterium sp.]|nr:hypothetical protein [Marinibacterium sp.]
MEYNLEVPLGFAAENVILVDRIGLLTHAAPEGASTIGYPTQDGNHTVTLDGIQAKGLARTNLNADSRNSIDEDGNALLAQMAELDMDIR